MADRKEFEIDGKPLSSLRVVDLKIELEKRGLSKSGSKKDLSDRLKVQLQLEKLHESASTDEGHVPNLRLQDDEIAEHNDLIKDYLAKQQQIYEIQKEAIRRVELEKRTCDSEASAGDTSQEEEDLEVNRCKAQQEADMDLNVSVQSMTDQPPNKQDVQQQQEDQSLDITDPKTAVEPIEARPQGQSQQIQSGSIGLTSEDIHPIQDVSKEDVSQAEIAKHEQAETSDHNIQDKANENNVELVQAVHAVSDSKTDEASLPSQSSEAMHEGVAEIDSKMTNEKDIGDSEKSNIPESSVAVDDVPSTSEADSEPMEISVQNIQVSPNESVLEKNVEERPHLMPVLSEPSGTVTAMESLTESKQENEEPVKEAADLPPTEKECDESDKMPPTPKQKPRLKRMETWSSAVQVIKTEVKESEVKDLKDVSVSVTEESTKEVESETPEGNSPNIATVEEENHRRHSEREVLANKPEKCEDKPGDDGPYPRTGSEHHSRARRRSRSSSASTSSSSSNSSSSSDESTSRSRSRSGSRSKSSASGSRSQSPKKTVEYPPEDSMETNEDSLSRSSPRRLAAKSEDRLEKTMEVDEQPLDAKEDRVTASASKVSEISHGEPTARISSRKISLSSSREKTEKVGEGKENQEASESEKPQRKRKWGGSGASAVAGGKRTSLSISTDSLKGLIPDVKPLSTLNSGGGEPVSESPNNVRDVTETEVQPDVKEVGDGSQPNVSIKKREVVKEKAKPVIPERDLVQGKRLVLKNSATSAVNDEPGATRRSPSPARYPPSCIVHVRNLVRPFTLNQLKELLSRTGTLVEGGFWIDKIKSKCYVTYSLESEAVATRQTLHGIQWPSSNPKRLIVDYATQDELEFHRNLTDAVEVKRKVVAVGYPPEVKEGPRAKSPPLPRRRVPVTADVSKGDSKALQAKDGHKMELEIPVRDQERSRRDQKHTSRSQSGGRGGKGERRGSGHEREGGDRHRAREREKENVMGGVGMHPPQPPIREWDRDKIGEKSPGERARAARNRNHSPFSRSRSRSRGARSPLPPDGFGRRDRDRDRGRMGMGPRDRRDKRVERRKEEEEAPAKLLDDLFRKTKSTPCIYWLPLTAEQIKLKEEERRLRQMEREKRKQQVEPVERERNLGLESTKRNREKVDDTRTRRRSESPSRSRARRR